MKLSLLKDLYVVQKKSVFQISQILECSENKINYWLAKYGIKKRTISDAIYQLKNPLGDPFSIRLPKTKEEGVLFGIGLGLFWGEGEKRSNRGVRLSNSDSNLVRKFIEFLEKFFSINRNKLRFSIQIHDDVKPEKAIEFWKKELNVNNTQFYKTIILKRRGKGTYSHKSENGVVILYFNNTKLKTEISNLIDNLR